MIYNFKKINKTLIGFFAILFFLSIFNLSNAATLSISPSDLSKKTGDIFSVRVLANSPVDVMNAFTLNMSFPVDKLEVISVSKSNSIIDFWAKEPAWNNITGNITLEGGVLNGYVGTVGELVSINFRAKKQGIANVLFFSGDILANDGLGTSIISSRTGGSITISDPIVNDEKELVTENKEEVPEEVKISSATHPDSSVWYSNNNPSFSWNLPNGVVNVDYIYGTSDKPIYRQDTSKGLIDSLELHNTEDGKQYLHVIFETGNGWGKSNSFVFNVDVTPPSDLKISRTANLDENSFTISAKDDASGISHYRIFIDGEYIEDWNEDDNYYLPKIKAGSHILSVEAVDNAGNMTQEQFDFVTVNRIVNIIEIYRDIIIIIILIIIIFIVLFRHQRLTKKYRSILKSVDNKDENNKLFRTQEVRLKEQLNKISSLEKSMKKVEKRVKKDLDVLTKKIDQ